MEPTTHELCARLQRLQAQLDKATDKFQARELEQEMYELREEIAERDSRPYPRRRISLNSTDLPGGALINANRLPK